MILLLLLCMLQEPGIEQRLDARVDPALSFVDDAGRPLKLVELLGRRPLIVAPVYYRCPQLCGLVLNGLASALKPLGFAPGVDFDVVAFSVAHEETPALAAAAKLSVLRRYGRPATAPGWRFLTGSSEDVGRFAAELGFRYRREPSGEIAHAAGIMVLTPDGRISRYFLGLEPPTRDLRLALVEAGEGRVGSLADRLTLLCVRWDPASGRYSFAVLGAARVGGALTVLALAFGIFRALRRERRRS